MHDTLREWAEVIRSQAIAALAVADEIDSCATKIEEGIFVSPDDIERLTSGQMIPNVSGAPPVRRMDTGPEVVIARADQVVYMREEQRADSNCVAAFVRTIDMALQRGKTVKVEYENGHDHWFLPSMVGGVHLPPWDEVT